MFSTTSSQPETPGTLARPVVSMVLTEPPPPEPSTMRMSGRRSALAICSHWKCFSLIVASAEPPRTVKSSPPITTGRPSTRARPKTKFEGTRSARSLLPSYSARPAILPISWKLPGSAISATRSRMFSRPPSFWRRTRSGPPSSSARASRRRSSSSSRCQDIAGSRKAIGRGRVYRVVPADARPRSWPLPKSGLQVRRRRTGAASVYRETVRWPKSGF